MSLDGDDATRRRDKPSHHSRNTCMWGLIPSTHFRCMIILNDNSNVKKNVLNSRSNMEYIQTQLAYLHTYTIHPHQVLRFAANLLTKGALTASSPTV